MFCAEYLLLHSKNRLEMEYTSEYYPDTVAEFIVYAVGTHFILLMPSTKSDLHLLLMQLSAGTYLCFLICPLEVRN